MGNKITKASKVTNKALLREVKRSKANGEMTQELAEMFIALVERYAKSPRYAPYPYVDECISHSLMNLSKSWNKFDPDRYDNAFAYYWTVLGCSFAYVLNTEARQRNIKKEYLEELDDGNKP